MTRLLTFLCLLITCRATAQCGYPVTLRSNKDYCVGSSLIASSTHAMQKITWYRNGQPVSTTTGIQSLSTQAVEIPIVLTLDSVFSSEGDVRLGTDDSDNIYILFDVGHLLKTKVLGASSQIAYFSDASNGGASPGMYVDPAGNVYVLSWNTLFSTGATTLVWEVPAGTVFARAADIPTVVPLSAIPNDSTVFCCFFIDCQKNFCLYQPVTGALYRYSPGATTATVIRTGIGTWAPCEGFTWGSGAIHMDQAGNIFFLSGSYVMKLAAGAVATTVAVPGSCTRDLNRLIYDFYLDGNDTIYLSGFNYNTNTAFVEKWAPGASAGQPLFSFSLQKNTIGNIPITMDRHGNIFLGYNNTSVNSPAPNLYEYKRTTSIDSTFTPTDTGAYYAVVTDIRGYTANSDTFHINDPSAGPPSIRITATATSTPVCTPITFTAQIANAGQNPSFQWQVSGVPAGGDSTSYSYNLFANGDDVYCIMSAQAGCVGPVQDTSNVIQLSIDPQGAASVAIATPKDSICSGDAAIFTATVTNGSNQPTFQWLLNGAATGDDSVTYARNNFKNGDVITCLITSDDACGLAKSNSISMDVSTRPVVESGQIFTILRGHSLTLTPVITGEISTWLWTPATGLSDPNIADPVADPTTNTLYTLTVTAPGGCSDSGTILVNVYTPLSIPGAFTPNGDGHNDIFYVLGGPVNSKIEDFAVYDRYGAEVFHVHDVAPGDPTHGWNGYSHGSPAPLGTYVYSILMSMADGAHQAYKGTVILIR